MYTWNTNLTAEVTEELSVKKLMSSKTLTVYYNAYEIVSNRYDYKLNETNTYIVSKT